MANEQWTVAADSHDLNDQPIVFSHQKKQIALFRAGNAVYAVDNRCPHEGYPLAKGSVDDKCQLTCNWHNWKFRLHDGECILGGDDVRAYPAKDEDGKIWVDLAPPPREIVAERILRGLKIAFQRREFDRICRELTRLKFSNIDPEIALSKAIEWSFDRLEFGSTHAYAAAADWLSESRGYEDDWERRLICLAEPIDHMSFDALRHPPYPFAAATDAAFSRDTFLTAVETEDQATAEGQVAAAFDAGLTWEHLEEAMTAAALAHFNDFGHSLIYVYKTAALAEALPNAARPLSLALARSICYATREDLIPEFSDYGPAWKQVCSATDLPRGEAPSAYPYPASTKTALKWVVDNLPRSDYLTLYDRLLKVLANNLLRFETSYGEAFDRPVSQNIGWLHLTHGLTFANAVRACCTRHPHLWPQGLLQMACFAGRNNPYLDHTVLYEDWRVADADQLFDEARSLMLDHGCRDPIFSAHIIKTAVAIEEELQYSSAETRDYLLAGLNRFLHSPIKQKHVRRLARQAIALVQLDYR